MSRGRLVAQQVPDADFSAPTYLALLGLRVYGKPLAVSLLGMFLVNFLEYSSPIRNPQA